MLFTTENKQIVFRIPDTVVSGEFVIKNFLRLEVAKRFAIILILFFAKVLPASAQETDTDETDLTVIANDEIAFSSEGAIWGWKTSEARPQLLIDTELNDVKVEYLQGVGLLILGCDDSNKCLLLVPSFSAAVPLFDENNHQISIDPQGLFQVESNMLVFTGVTHEENSLITTYAHYALRWDEKREMWQMLESDLGLPLEATEALFDSDGYLIAYQTPEGVAYMDDKTNQWEFIQGAVGLQEVEGAIKAICETGDICLSPEDVGLSEGREVMDWTIVGGRLILQIRDTDDQLRLYYVDMSTEDDRLIPVTPGLEA